MPAFSIPSLKPSPPVVFVNPPEGQFQLSESDAAIACSAGLIVNFMTNPRTFYEVQPQQTKRPAAQAGYIWLRMRFNVDSGYNILSATLGAGGTMPADDTEYVGYVVANHHYPLAIIAPSGLRPLHRGGAIYHTGFWEGYY